MVSYGLRLTMILVAFVLAGLLLGFLFTPFMVCVAGMGVWVLLWFVQGGMAEGNPYKRMNMRGGTYNWAVVNQYQKNEEIEIKDRGSAMTAIFFFAAGALLIALGLIWMWMEGANFT